MGNFYEDPDWPRCIYWKYDPATGWNGFNLQLDQVIEYANDAENPFIIVFHALGDVPRGNPIPHMQRIVQFSKTHPKVMKMIIIMGANWAVAKVFTNILNKILALEPEVKIVFSESEARDVYQHTLEHPAK